MKRNGLLAVLAVALLATLLLAYSNHFNNPFQFDDSHTIETNSAIRDLRNIPRFFTEATTGSTQRSSDYRPVLTTLNAIDYALAGGLNPFTFHRSIFISYLILGVLLYLFYLRIGQMAAEGPWLKLLALGATGWFMLHAANAETINYIIQRGDSFSTLMVVLGLVIYMYKPGWRKYGFYLIPLVIGFLTKTPALMFAPLLFVYSLLFERNAGLTARVRDARWPKVFKSASDALPASMVAVGLVLLSNAMSPAYRFLTSRPGFNYLITQPFVFVHYFDNFLLPLQFSVDTDWKLLTSPIDDRFFAGTAFILLMLGVAAYASRRKEGRPITFGILWFFIALLPTSSFIPLDEVLNDHRPFFAYIGLVLAGSWAIGLLIMRYEAFFQALPARPGRAGCPGRGAPAGERLRRLPAQPGLVVGRVALVRRHAQEPRQRAGADELRPDPDGQRQVRCRPGLLSAGFATGAELRHAPHQPGRRVRRPEPAGGG